MISFKYKVKKKSGSLNIPLYLGTDGEASNDDLSISHERDFLKNRYKNVDKSIIDLIGCHPIDFGDGFVGNLDTKSFCDLQILDSKNHVKDVFVGGKKVVSDYELISMNVEKDIETPLKQILKELF